MNIINRDINRRNLVNNFELKKLQIKYLLLLKDTEFKIKKNLQKKLIKLSKNTSKVRIKNRCIITGRSKAVYKNFRLSRFMFRDLALTGRIPGVKKASW